MEEKKNILSKETLISVSLVMTIMAVTFFCGKLSEKVDITSTRVDKLEAVMKDLPTRNEFNALRETITQGFADVKAQIKTAN